MLGKLRLWQKFSLIALIFLLPLVVLLTLLVQEQNATLSFTAKEIQGVEYLSPSYALMIEVAEHRDLHMGTFTGGTNFQERLDKKKADVEKALSELSAVNDKFSSVFSTNEQLEEIKSDWADIVKTLSSLSPEDSYDKHSHMIVDISRLLVIMGNDSNLVLDQHVDSHYCMDVVVFKIPKLNEDLSRLRSKVLNSLMLFSDFSEKKEALVSLRTIAEESFSTMAETIKYGIAYNREVEDALKKSVDNASTVNKKMIEDINTKLIFAKTDRIASNAAFELIDQAIQVNVKLYNQTAMQLDELLQSRIDEIQQKRLFSLLGVGFSILFSVALLILILRSVRRSIVYLSMAAEKISLGDLNEDIVISSSDEIGELGEKFKRMQASLKAAMSHLDNNDPL